MTSGSPLPLSDSSWHRPTRLFAMPALADDRLSDRKRRLFAAACLRRFAHLLADPRSRRALAVAERFAEGLASEDERQQAEDAAFAAHAEMREGRFGGETLVPWSWPGEQLTRAATLSVSLGLYYAEDVADYARRSLVATGAGWLAEQQEEAEQCRLLHEIVGPLLTEPLRVDPAWLAANDGAAAGLARYVYDQQAFGEMPILADALEDAGCTEQALLEHCRGGGPHVPGCWVLDLLTGRR
jgi:hypothetical protein